MPNGKEVLLNYINKYIDLENNSTKNNTYLKRLNKLLNVIKDKRYIVDFKEIEELVKKYESSDVDNILYEVFLNVCRYNNYLSNNKIKFVEPNLDKDIELEEFDPNKVDISDIMNSLGIETIDENLEYDLKKYIKNENNKKKFVDFASRLKTNDVGEILEERVIFERLVDKNVLVSILMYSDINIVRGVISKLKEKNISILKILENMPSIFIPVSDTNAKFHVPACYDKFMGNIITLEEYSVDIKLIVNNSPYYLIKDVNGVKEELNRLNGLGVKVKNVLENVGKVFSIYPEVIFNNIEVLKKYNIELTDDENNYGYRILGMRELDKKIEYLIANNIWNRDNRLDNIDLLNGLFIKLSYVDWKNNLELKKSKNDGNIDNVPFEEEQIGLGENEDVSRVPKRI